MFDKFLESLKRPDNVSLIEAIQKGYDTIFESPIAEVVIDNKPKFIDFHVEDYYHIYGPETTLEYVQDIMRKLVNNETVEVDKKFLRSSEIPILEEPRNKFIRERDFTELLEYLKKFEIGLKDQITNMVPA